jgi:hypothetical protein
MPRPDDGKTARRDWRAWLALAWAVWFGALYGKMVVERRGEKVRAAVAGPREAPARR